MDMLRSGAPWVWDIVGGGMVAIVVIFLVGGAPALMGFRRPDPNPHTRNRTRMSCAAAGIVVALYAAHFLAWGMGGYLPLLMFLPNFAAWSWTVLLTVAVWGLITAWSVTSLIDGWRKPPGDRNAIPYKRAGLELALFGGAWAWGMFVPVPRYASFPLAWQAATTANFFLHCGFIGATVESLGVLLLPRLPSQSVADKAMTAQVDDPNRRMYPVKRRPGQ